MSKMNKAINTTKEMQELIKLQAYFLRQYRGLLYRIWLTHKNIAFDTTIHIEEVPKTTDFIVNGKDELTARDVSPSGKFPGGFESCQNKYEDLMK